MNDFNINSLFLLSKNANKQMKTKPVDITMSLKIKEEKMEIVNRPATECLRP